MSAPALVLAASLLLAAACRRQTTGAAPQERLPRDASRFEIESVDDSTARFRPFEASWLRVGMTVSAVDPTQRDALVARLRIVRSDSGRFVALVTSQVTRVTTNHFLLAARPKTPWYRAQRFWWGVLAGGTAGTATSVIAR